DGRCGDGERSLCGSAIFTGDGDGDGGQRTDIVDAHDSGEGAMAIVMFTIAALAAIGDGIAIGIDDETDFLAGDSDDGGVVGLAIVAEGADVSDGGALSESGQAGLNGGGERTEGNAARIFGEVDRISSGAAVDFIVAGACDDGVVA